MGSLSDELQRREAAALLCPGSAQGRYPLRAWPLTQDQRTRRLSPRAPRAGPEPPQDLPRPHHHRQPGRRQQVAADRRAAPGGRAR